MTTLMVRNLMKERAFKPELRVEAECLKKQPSERKTFQTKNKKGRP